MKFDIRFLIIAILIVITALVIVFEAKAFISVLQSDLPFWLKWKIITR